MIPEKRNEAPVVRGSGWVTAPPLTSPPGQDHIERLVDHADAMDRLERLRKLLELVRQPGGKPDEPSRT